VRVLAQRAKWTEQLLRELETLVQNPVDCHEQDGAVPSECLAPCPTGQAAKWDEGTDCLRCAIAALLRRHRAAAS
jgi:hypothetical protein